MIFDNSKFVVLFTYFDFKSIITDIVTWNFYEWLFFRSWTCQCSFSQKVKGMEMTLHSECTFLSIAKSITCANLQNSCDKKWICIHSYRDGCFCDAVGSGFGGGGASGLVWGPAGPGLGERVLSVQHHRTNGYGRQDVNPVDPQVTLRVDVSGTPIVQLEIRTRFSSLDFFERVYIKLP